jgi:isopenicillin-N N-acyltransferase like protein
MTTTEDIATVTVRGAGWERGRAVGEALRPLIALGMARWKDRMRAAGVDPYTYISRFVAETDFMPAIERWAPDLLEEVRAMAEGADQPFRDMYAYQLMDEEWLFWVDGQRGRHHCSVVAAAEEGAPVILAQNMDLPANYDGTQTLLRIENLETGITSLVFTAAGLIGLCGLNSAGVGLCVNTISQLAHTDAGLPVAFVARTVLEQPSAEAAAAFVRDISHASGQNYAIGGPAGIIDLEASAGKVAPYMEGARRVCHTNHPLSNDDLAEEQGGARELTSEKSNSERRYDYLEGAMAEGTEPLTAERAMDLLRTREVPISVVRDPAGSSVTLGSLVMELSAPPVLHLAPGPPSETEYRTWTFAEA